MNEELSKKNADDLVSELLRFSSGSSNAIEVARTDTGYIRAIVTRVDQEGIPWVHIDGGASETPITGSIVSNVSPGDVVGIDISGNQAAITQNVTSPAVNDRDISFRLAPITLNIKSIEEQAEINKKIAEEAREVAEDTSNHFWDDEYGAHVTDVTKDEFNAAIEDGFSDYDESTKPYRNTLVGRLGILLRSCLNNLVSITRGAIAFYDGAGNESTNIMARFGSDGAQIGNESDNNVAIDSDGVTFSGEIISGFESNFGKLAYFGPEYAAIGDIEGVGYNLVMGGDGLVISVGGEEAISLYGDSQSPELHRGTISSAGIVEVYAFAGGGSNSRRYYFSDRLSDSKNGNYAFEKDTAPLVHTHDGLMPIGTILDFAGATAPTGYLECDGSAVSRTDYADLFVVLGTTWGAGDGSTTFNLPNLNGRTTIGENTSHALGSTGGAETVKLTAAQSGLPAHGHGMTQPAFTLPDHKHETNTSGTSFVRTISGAEITRANVGSGSAVTNVLRSTQAFASNTVTGNPQSNPGCTRSTNAAVTDASAKAATDAHNNMQPYATVKKIIRAK